MTASGLAQLAPILESGSGLESTARLLFVHPNGSKLGTERSLSMRGAQAGLVETVTLPVTGTYRVKFDPEFKALSESLSRALPNMPIVSFVAGTSNISFAISLMRSSPRLPAASPPSLTLEDYAHLAGLSPATRAELSRDFG